MKKVAYGDWKVDGVECPISKSCKTENTWATNLAEKYDSIMRQLYDLPHEHAVSKDKAEEGWNVVIKMLENEKKQAEHRDEKVQCDRMLELAKGVKSEVFD